MILRSNKYEYILIERLGLLINPEMEEEFNDIIPGEITDEEVKQIVKGLRKEISDEEIDTELSNVSNLVFCITENCNLRCSYCGYSGIYSGERTHSSNKISFETALKGIDLFFEYIDMETRTKKRKALSIGFYGGEPLLEIDLINKIIDYALKRSCELALQDKFEFDFSLTTNGILLRDDIVDLLVTKNIAIAVSIDGPKETHDKFRVTADKNGSWQAVMDNLYRIKNHYPEFYKRRVTFLCTVHPLYNGKAIDEFFLSHQQYFDLSKITFSNLKRESLKESVLRSIREEVEKYPNSRLMFEKNILKTFDTKKFKINILRPSSKLTGACFPGGHNFFIGVNGNIHICESINHNFPIGNVYDGISYNNIRSMIRTFSEGIIKKRCWECEVWFLCNSCYAPSANGKELRLHCPKKNIINGLIDYLCHKEGEYEKSQAGIAIDSVHDYLEFLQ
jgi:uncharacterized protein